jgi:cob(I)alamin adenosyltransferase
VKIWAGSSFEDPVGVYIPQDRCLRKISIYPFGDKKAKTPSLNILKTGKRPRKRLYTRGGDKGETGLYGASRVPKDSPRVDAYGTVDELNSCIGVAVAGCRHEEISKPLKRIQADLFTAGADLATEFAADGGARVPRIGGKDTERLEKMVDELQGKLPRLTSFILPGGSELSSSLHLARAVCRRAERRVVALGRAERINPDMVPYLNRLSTYLFNAARYANVLEGVEDEVWGQK